MATGASMTAAQAPDPSETRGQATWVECSTCTGPIRRSTGRCPHCGARTRRSRRLSRSAVAAGVLVAVAIAIRRWLTSRRQ